MIILSALAGGLVYLGLAVLGWGGFAAFFAHPARLVLPPFSSSSPRRRCSARATSARASAKTAVTAGLSARSA